MNALTALFLVKLLSASAPQEAEGSAPTTTDPSKLNSVSLELGGPSPYAGLSFERRLVETAAVRAGIGILPHAELCIINCQPTPRGMQVFLEGLFLAGDGRNSLEFGAGASADATFGELPTPLRDLVAVHAVVGYRFQSSSGFQFRANLTPMFKPWSSGEQLILPWVGGSVGYAF